MKVKCGALAWLLTIIAAASCGAVEKHFQAGVLALTFDDGPSYDTEKILEVLHRERAVATFFFIGLNVEKHLASARAVAEAGHEIGNHLYSHGNMGRSSAKVVGAELRQAEAVIEKATGRRPALVRFPYGNISKVARAECLAQGYTVVKWTVNSGDWSKPGVDQIIGSVLAGAKSGAIVLFHDGGGDRKQTVEALAVLIPELKRRGFRLATVSDVLGMSAVEGAKRDGR